MVYRDRKGRIRKFTTKVKLVTEVWSKRTGRKVKGVTLNKVEEGRPVSRRFSSRARALYHQRVSEFDAKPKYLDRHVFHYDNFVSYQVPKKWSNQINNTVEMDGFAVFSLKVYLPGKERPLETETISFTEEKSWRVMREIIATMIIQLLRSNRIRTSPKKLAGKNPYWKTRKGVRQWEYFKKYEVELVMKVFA